MKLCYILIILFVYRISEAQKANVFVKDLVTNQMDTLRFGYDKNATIGVDTLLGEKNIRNAPLKSLDFRILQRDYIDFYCLNPFDAKVINGDIVYDSIFYSPSFDSKVNYRPRDRTNRYFEFLMHYENDVRFKMEFTDKLKYFLDRIVFYVKECPYSKPIVVTPVDTNIAEVETLIFNAFDSGYHLIMVFKDTFDLSTGNKNISKDSYLNYYPNPIQDFISIEINGDYQYIEIIDVNGKIIFKDLNLIGTNYYQLHARNWTPGFYFIRAFDRINKVLVVNKLIKL